MRPSRPAAFGFVLSCVYAFGVAACGSSKSKSSDVDTHGGGSAGSVNLGPDLGTGAGGQGSDGSGDIDACAGDLVQGQRVPLDMYVMLDVSGSMLEATAGDANVTKWQAVSSALTDFVSDKASEGIGVGLQVFPIDNAGAPTSCKQDGDCGDFGPCLNRACWPLISGQLVACVDNAGCAGPQTCKVVGECSQAADYVCDYAASTTCGAARGDCVLRPSVCVSANDCRPATYENPAAPIAQLPTGKDSIVQVIAQSTPKTSALTPTGPALTGAIAQASNWAGAHTDHQVVAVLATDGLPTLKTSGMLCAPVLNSADVQAVLDVATGGKRGKPSISTFVIGVVSPDDVTSGAPDLLNAIADAGGTTQSFIVNTMGDVQMQFRAALDKIRQAGLSCDLKVPEPSAGRTLDYGQVNVRFDDGKGSKTLGYVQSAANCTAAGGWYYDVDPAVGAPERIVACPTTCDAFQKADMGSVKIELGCATKVVK